MNDNDFNDDLSDAFNDNKATSEAKSIAIINSKAPYSHIQGKDALDLALIFGSYEQPISLFFQGDGVWQLLAEQSAESIQAKDYTKTFAALHFYDIENIYVCQQSLVERGFTDSVLTINNVVSLSPEQWINTLQQHQFILRF